MKPGLIHLYYGNGKGKTTAAMGLCLRAAGNGKQVTVLQFLKDGTSSELNVLRNLPNVTVLSAPTEGFTFQMNDEQRERTRASSRALFQEAVESAFLGGCDVLLLDEACLAVKGGFLDSTLLEHFLRAKPEGLELILTGRSPADFMLECADYVTEMVCRKHPYQRGVSARPGIEY
ncbi:MAG: Cob(I)alamin adenosyltransferase [Oscillospiraceae bacterium]|nr:Cob(I)alamin adenosyltransferase [Oscillospiraceae bacterium]